jgi:2-methylcitrate dehydratase PrpD
MRALADFVVKATPPLDARAAAARAVLDTVGVTLAGASEPAARIVARVATPATAGPCGVLGTRARGIAVAAALANGTAAHALDFDDMCFVSLAHPSAPLVAAALAAAELLDAPGRALLDAYIVGFEIEGRLGRTMNPRHYERGWHCTSTLGTIGAAAAASRLLGLDADATCHALAIAASEASGLKENFGTMVKPLHAGLAARNGVLAALLAQAGLSASANAIAGTQGFLAAMCSERDSAGFDETVADLGARWEIVDTGITVKLYPSCAATHPMLDVLLDLRRDHQFTGEDVDAIDVGVDPITPTVLIHDHPTTGLQAKFSMPFCAAAAAVRGHVGIDTFDDQTLRDPAIGAVRQRVAMAVDSTLDPGVPPLTQARVRVRLRDGRVLERLASGARGYPERPASDEELGRKFLSCATRVLPDAAAQQALAALRAIDAAPSLRSAIDLVLLKPERVEVV